jgi:hypothetical protein
MMPVEYSAIRTSLKGVSLPRRQRVLQDVGGLALHSRELCRAESIVGMERL